jgi:hypothetical protein
MSHVFRRALPLVCALATLAAAPAGAAAQSPPQWHGVPVAIGPLTAPELQQAAQVGANAVEVFAQWSSLEPKANGVFDQGDVSELDAAVDGAAALGMKVILRARGTPCWASTEPPEARAVRPDLCEAYPPTNPGLYGQFVTWLAQRYAGKLAAIEVWAEEDHDDGQHFAGPDRPGHYAALLKTAYAAVQASGSPVPVIIGAMVGADGSFLDALYKDGIQGHYNGIAVDFYNVVLASMRAIHQVQLAHGDHTPQYLEEFGWTTCSTPRSIAEEYFVCVSPQQQGVDIDDVYRALSGVPWVAGAQVFTLRDNPNLHFGISNADGSPKASFAAVAQAFHGQLGPPRPVTLKVKGRSLVGTAPVGDQVAIVVRPPRGKPGKTYTAYVTLSVNGTYSSPLPRAARKGWLVSATEPWTHGHAALTL